MRYTPFRMERYQSTYEHRVHYNLSESGVHPMTVGELIEIAGVDVPVDDIRLGYGQSNGSDGLRHLIADLYPGATAASVLVTVGGAEANFTCFWHLFESEGKAAIILPTYGQVPGLLESFGSRLSPVQLLEQNGWQPDLEALERALAEGVRFVLVTNPNNPTGVSLTRESMDAIAELTERHGAWIMADEVYAGAETNVDMNAEATPSFWGCHDRVLITNSLSKAYGLPGLRLGWIVGPSHQIGELWGRTDYTTIAPANVSDALACVALEPNTRARIIERTRGIVRANLGVLKSWMAEQRGRFSYQSPDAGAICYARYDAAINSTEFAEKLRLEKDVLVVPGDHFGMDHYLRIGFGNPPDELIKALELVREAFDEVTA
ncbi:MAG: aminotransferase class I/II-fold pyridoxal phosphate-dependent enzyme [Gemmatimonadota bacterium]|nr:aminotransferase class I/II-fold pyridoxal phosphate-dependent enzyme [Gemmatimonadota bacterium]